MPSMKILNLVMILLLTHPILFPMKQELEKRSQKEIERIWEHQQLHALHKWVDLQKNQPDGYPLYVQNTKRDTEVTRNNNILQR